MQDDGAAVEPLPENRDRVVVRGAVVDDDGQLSLPREPELVDEQLRLRIPTGVVTVVIESDLSEPDDLWMAQELHERGEVEARLRLVRMEARYHVHVVLGLGDSQRFRPRVRLGSDREDPCHPC